MLGIGHHERTVLVVNPSADVYGSDLQMLLSVHGMHAHGMRVVVVMPEDGPLVARLRAAGAEVLFTRFPVLRRSCASPRGVTTLGGEAISSLGEMRRLIVQVGASLVYVNTVTLPWWLLAARLARVPAVCHAHEAEASDPLPIRVALASPLSLASAVIVNSRSTLDVLGRANPVARRKAHLIYNGVSGPMAVHPHRQDRARCRLLVVGRLSPRKAPHIALEAAAILRSRRRAVELALCGSGLPQHADYVRDLHLRARQRDLAGAVSFIGYTSPIWPALERADLLVAPSLGESLGNAVIEAQLALRPVIATAVQGHLETIVHESTGLLTPPEDAVAMADAVERLLDDAHLAGVLAHRARRSALTRFSSVSYTDQIVDLVGATACWRKVGSGSREKGAVTTQ